MIPLFYILLYLLTTSNMRLLEIQFVKRTSALNNVNATYSEHGSLLNSARHSVLDHKTY